MRIAYVCADRGIPVFGRKGSSIHVQEVTRALIRRGVQVDLFAHRLEGQPPPGVEAVTAHPLPAVSDASDPAAHQQSLLAFHDALREQLERMGPWDAVYERYSLWSAGGMEYAHSAGIPGVLEVNAPLIEEQERHRGLENRASAEAVVARCFGAAGTIICVSLEVANYARDFDGVAPRVHVVQNGVDPARFRDADARPREDTAPFTVGFLGSLRPWHGLEPLVDAFALLHQRDPSCRLLIVGDGPERDSLTAQIERLGIGPAAELTGALAPADVPEALYRMDVATAPYAEVADFYFSPLKIFEYMAAGIPTVASRVGQIEDILEQGQTGLLCPPGDPEALAESLDRLRLEPELRRRMGRTARQTALREHTWDARVAQIFGYAGIG